MGCFLMLCRHRLVVRTPGFHPGNRGSIPRGDAREAPLWAFFAILSVYEISYLLDTRITPDIPHTVFCRTHSFNTS